VLISESTHAELLGRYRVEFAGEREVKGKKNRVRVYRVLGELQQ
jgi:class 3 adenylate cyclase